MDYNSLIASEEVTILDGLKQLNTTAKGVLFLVRDNRLVAAVSDGDIRRWILNQGSLDASISNAANYSPRFIHDNDRGKAADIMQRGHFEALPVTDREGHIIDILFLYNDDDDPHIEKFRIPVVIMAGGKGTRLYPYTKILPKPLIPIGDIPISEHIVNSFTKFGCNEFWFIVNYKKNMIKAYYRELDNVSYSVRFIDEDVPLGTGGGIRLLKGKIDQTFILTNCDTIIEENFAKVLKEHKERKNLVTMICSLRNYVVPYGVVEIGENGSIRNMTEKPSMSFFTNTGTYIVEPEVIDEIQEGENIGFPDVINRLKDSGKKVGVYPVNESSWLDMGQFDTMESMKERLHIKE